VAAAGRLDQEAPSLEGAPGRRRGRHEFRPMGRKPRKQGTTARVVLENFLFRVLLIHRGKASERLPVRFASDESERLNFGFTLAARAGMIRAESV